jgi:hypothetical protein
LKVTDGVEAAHPDLLRNIWNPVGPIRQSILSKSHSVSSLANHTEFNESLCPNDIHQTSITAFQNMPSTNSTTFHSHSNSQKHSASLLTINESKEMKATFKVTSNIWILTS